MDPLWLIINLRSAEKARYSSGKDYLRHNILPFYQISQNPCAVNIVNKFLDKQSFFFINKPSTKRWKLQTLLRSYFQQVCVPTSICEFTGPNFRLSSHCLLRNKADQSEGRWGGSRETSIYALNMFFFLSAMPFLTKSTYIDTFFTRRRIRFFSVPF